MNIVIVHGFAHRLRTDGLLESAPVLVGASEALTVADSQWDIRSYESMDLSGGDWSEIYNTLNRFKDIFATTARRLPTPGPIPQTLMPEASTIR